jgi:hypothetical protein
MRQGPYYTNVYYKLYINGSINIDNKIYYYFKNNIYNISFVKVIIVGPKKPILISKIKCIIFMEQLYCMYYNTRPNSALKGVIVACFHPIVYFVYYMLVFCGFCES